MNISASIYDVDMTFYQQIQRVIDHIERHLFDDLKASDLAAIANMSLAGFYRYFGALTGFSVQAYIRRRRLSHSLEWLTPRHASLLSIAIECGYSSHEAFTRAFKHEFGQTPTQYCLGTVQLRGIQRKNLVEETQMGLVVKEIDELPVVSYRVISRAPEIDAWAHMKQFAQANGLFEKPYRCFGKNKPGPDKLAELKSLTPSIGDWVREGEYGYEVMVAFDSELAVKTPANGRGVHLAKLKAGTFAVLGIGAGCEEDDIERGWRKLISLAKANGFKPTGRWFEEHFDFEMAVDREPDRLDLYLEVSDAC